MLKIQILDPNTPKNPYASPTKDDHPEEKGPSVPGDAGTPEGLAGEVWAGGVQQPSFQARTGFDSTEREAECPSS